VTIETATVYRAAGRRWFTKKAAINAEARAMIKKRCECGKPDRATGDGGWACRFHDARTGYGARVKARLVRWLSRRCAGGGR